jgi:hypothetical protein
MLVESQWQHWNWHMCYPMHAAAEVARRRLLRDVLAVSRGTAILNVKNGMFVEVRFKSVYLISFQ